MTIKTYRLARKHGSIDARDFLRQAVRERATHTDISQALDFSVEAPSDNLESQIGRSAVLELFQVHESDFLAACKIYDAAWRKEVLEFLSQLGGES